MINNRSAFFKNFLEKRDRSTNVSIFAVRLLITKLRFAIYGKGYYNPMILKDILGSRLKYGRERISQRDCMN